MDCLLTHTSMDLLSIVLGRRAYSVDLPQLFPFPQCALFPQLIFCLSEASTSTCLQKRRSIRLMTMLRRLHTSSLQLPTNQTLMAIQLNEQTTVTYLAMITLCDWSKRIPVYIIGNCTNTMIKFFFEQSLKSWLRPSLTESFDKDLLMLL